MHSLHRYSLPSLFHVRASLLTLVHRCTRQKREESVRGISSLFHSLPRLRYSRLLALSVSRSCSLVSRACSFPVSLSTSSKASIRSRVSDDRPQAAATGYLICLPLMSAGEPPTPVLPLHLFPPFLHYIPCSCVLMLASDISHVCPDHPFLCSSLLLCLCCPAYLPLSLMERMSDFSRNPQVARRNHAAKTLPLCSIARRCCMAVDGCRKSEGGGR